MKLKSLILLLATLVAVTAADTNRQAILSWDPNGEPIPVPGDGSAFAVGTFDYLGVYTNGVDTYGMFPKVDIPYNITNGLYQVTTNVTLSNLVQGVVYASYVTAYNEDGVESEPSNTIRWDHHKTLPGQPYTFDMSILSTNTVTLTNHYPPFTMVTNGNLVTFTPPGNWTGGALAKMTATEDAYPQAIGLYSGIRVSNDVFMVQGIRIVP